MVQTLTLNLLKFGKLLYSKSTHENVSLDRPVYIATSWTAGVRFPEEARNISLFYSAQAHPAFSPTGTGDTFPGGKVAGA
jgi:hypothetical protein